MLNVIIDDEQWKLPVVCWQAVPAKVSDYGQHVLTWQEMPLPVDALACRHSI